MMDKPFEFRDIEILSHAGGYFMDERPLLLAAEERPESVL
jgi:hypothetical protein